MMNLTRGKLAIIRAALAAIMESHPPRCSQDEAAYLEIKTVHDEVTAFLSEDWQADIDDDGVAAGICPRCSSRASTNLDGRRVQWRWECDDCGHASPWET